MDEVKRLISACTQQVLEHRRWLHAHAEVSGKERETAAYIAKTLREMGLTPTEGVGGYGVVALIEGTGSGKCIGLRADFDALPVEETTGLPFASIHEGVMHACGHDAHTAMLLGAAWVLTQLRERFSGSVKLIFQPSEENNMDSGAKKMIAAGVLESPKVDAILGQHVWPQGEVGTVLIRNGAMMAASDRFDISIYGKKSHGSAPETGVDAIVIAAEVVSLLQTIVSRKVGPLESAVITVGEVRGGSRYNIIADEVKMVGTCRTLASEVRETIPAYIEKIVKGVTESMGGTYEFAYHKGYSPTVNHPEMFRLVCDTAEKTVGSSALLVPERAALTAEDFSFFCEKVPSGYFWLGCQDKSAPFYPLHSGDFTPSEQAFPVGMEVMVRAALKFLGDT